ncbi:MAG: O-antigen ligase family protein [Acidimicrobiia bacterium]|nr:O-antigen ligase family protein [Acidimicrobiia bacterium]
MESPLRLGVQALVIASAVTVALAYPAHFVSMFRNPATRWLIGLTTLAILSTTWSFDPARTFMQGATAFAGVLLVVLHSEIRGWQSTRAVLMRGFVVVIALGIAVDLASGSEQVRWAGVAGAATQLAQFAVMTAALALLGWLRGHETTIFTTGVTGLCLTVAFLSQSRVALLVLVCLCALTVYLRADRAVRPMAILGVVATVAMAASALVNQIGQLALRDDTEVGDLTELTGRTSIWSESLELYPRRPVVGHGFASGESIWADRVFTGEISWYPSNAHNVFLETLLSLGLLGSVVLLGLVVSVFIHRQNGDGIAASILVVVVLVLGSTEAMVHFASPAFVVLALACSALQLPGRYNLTMRHELGAPAIGAR